MLFTDGPDEGENSTEVPGPDECMTEYAKLEAQHQCGNHTNYETNDELLNSYNISMVKGTAVIFISAM